jgi:hypothetical protein
MFDELSSPPLSSVLEPTAHGTTKKMFKKRRKK